MAFKLDTSGSVGPKMDAKPPLLFDFRWGDLSPFTQGYIEALFASFRETMTRADERKRPACTLSDGQIWLLKHGRGGFSRTTLRVPFSGHGSKATNVMCAGLIRRGWLEKKDNGIVQITEAGERALHTATPLAFSDLAPETLARIIADCEAAQVAQADHSYKSTGLEFWMVRQRGHVASFPPLTVQLGDDGKVRFAV